MTAMTTIGPALYERLVDRMRHCEQCLDATSLMAQGACELLEAIKQEEEVNHDGESAS